MRIVLWILLAVIAFFGFMNWPVLNAPVQLWLGVTTVAAPLGWVVVVLFGIVLVLMLVEQSIVLAENRRYGRELEAQRKLADQAEASRLTELRTFLANELAQAEQRAADVQIALMTRADQLEHALRAALDQQGNSLAATIAELDDRLKRGNTALR